MTVPSPPRILVADCRDSFVYTIVDYLSSLGAQVTICRAEDLRVEAWSAQSMDGLLLSPGPGTPGDASICHRLLDAFAGQVPVLGVCLGHQVIAEHYGATVTKADEPRHGENSQVLHDGRNVFAGLPSPLTATRYHSLTVDPGTVPSVLEVTARTDDGVVMGLRHRQLDIQGVQFHPEAVMSEGGHSLLRNWMKDMTPDT